MHDRYLYATLLGAEPCCGGDLFPAMIETHTLAGARGHTHTQTECVCACVHACACMLSDIHTHTRIHGSRTSTVSYIS